MIKKAIYFNIFVFIILMKIKRFQHVRFSNKNLIIDTYNL